MVHRGQEHVFALACLSVASCASVETLPEKNVFAIDECAPVVEIYSVNSETRSDEQPEGIPEGFVETYVGTAPRLPEDCV